jgi:hypothetical protein
MIDRRNVLELIGQYRGRYHSCILTCYALDFAFFEEQVLPTLRNADIRNVNIFADGRFLEQAQEHTTGKEFRHNKTYNFQAIYEKGVFHPKILLLTGKKYGLLIIGSGNLTSSGLSTNDEIWGAFQLDSIENENAPLFKAVWNYLQAFLEQTYGSIKEKIRAIGNYSPWLNELPATSDWIEINSLNLRIAFIGNTVSGSGFQQIIEKVPAVDMEEVNIISPFYDASGNFLKQIKEYYKPNQMRCLLDPNSGLLPKDLDPDVAKEISFYAWAQCKKDYEDTYNRLHAKIIHFLTKDKEYMLLGSANATTAAMGTASGQADNAEAGVLVHRERTCKTWIEELNISIPSSTIDVLSLQTVKRFQADQTSRATNKVRILHSELKEHDIVIFLDRAYNEPLKLVLLDRAGLLLEGKLRNNEKMILNATVAEAERLFKLRLTDEDGRALSNFSIVHDSEALSRGIPTDKKHAALDALFAQEFQDGDGITELLQFVESNWADSEQNNSSKKIIIGGAGGRKEQEPDQEKEYKNLPAEEFNKVSAEMMLRQTGELSHANVRIVDFLNRYSAAAFGKEDDFQEREEQKLLDDKNQKGEGGTTNQEQNTHRSTVGSLEKARIHAYLRTLDRVYDQRLKKFITSAVINESPEDKIILQNLSSILIALHLVQMKYGKRFTVLTKDEDSEGNKLTQQDSYILAGTDGSDSTSLKGFLLNVLGKYLLLSTAGTKPYDFEIVNEKLEKYQLLLLSKTIFLVLNTPWRESEYASRNLLILNCLFYTVGERLQNPELSNTLLKKITDLRSYASYLIPDFGEHFRNFQKELLPKYIRWLVLFYADQDRKKELFSLTSGLKFGDIIFKRRIGFNVVRNVRVIDNGLPILTLSRPGYPYESGEFLLRNVQYTNISIRYE